MKIVIGLIIVLVCLYALVGVVMAFYEQSQTDDKFNPITIITWLPKMLGLKNTNLPY